MSIPHVSFELPTLITLDPALLHTLSIPPLRHLEPRPVSVCILTRQCKPLEAENLDLARDIDCTTLAEMTESVVHDDLALIIWPTLSPSPLTPAYDLLRRMVARHTVDPLPDTPFVHAWVKEARELLIDYHGINELLDFKEPPPQLDDNDDEL